MKRYCGCNRPTERRKRTCEDEERAAEKMRLPIFWLPHFFCAVKYLWNGGRDDRLKQPNGTKGTTVERQFDCFVTQCFHMLFIIYTITVKCNYTASQKQDKRITSFKIGNNNLNEHLISLRAFSQFLFFVVGSKSHKSLRLF
jgi:hypothetical protein